MRAVLLSGYLWWAAPSLGLSRTLVLGFDRQALRGWVAYMKVALPALVQTCSEWWFWEITSFMAGYLGSETLAAHVTAQNIYALADMVPFGTSTGAAAMVGNAVGGGEPLVAKRIAWLAVAATLVVWLVMAVAILLGHAAATSLFTKDPAVQRLAGTLLLINFWASGPLECCSSVIGGVCRGVRKLKARTGIFLVSYYCVMLPAALLLMFPLQWGIRGLYWAMVLGTAVCCAALLATLRRADWSELSERAAARIALAAAEARDLSGECAAGNG